MKKIHGLENHEKIYEDVDKILGGTSIYDVGALVGRTEKIEDKNLEKLKSYAEDFLEGTDRGLLYTMILNLKPFSKTEIIKPIFDKLIAKRKKNNE